MGEKAARVGRYTLGRLVGRGGMGDVYLAVDGATGSPVALKLLRVGSFGSDTIRRFEREVIASRRVSDRRVAVVLDADVEGPEPYLVTGFLQGVTLRDWVSTWGPLPEDGTWQLAAGLLLALEAVHRADVVHRDLSPGNVMLTPDGPVLLDFGISLLLDATRLTTTSGFVGTPTFAAPEQIEGMAVTAATDLYQWAATITFAATGSPPVHVSDPRNTMFRILNGELDLGGLPADLGRVLRSALATDPLERPSLADLAAMLQTVRGVQTLEDAEAAPWGWVPVADLGDGAGSPPRARRRRGVAAGVAATAVAVAGAALGAALLFNAQAAGEDPTTGETAATPTAPSTSTPPTTLPPSTTAAPPSTQPGFTSLGEVDWKNMTHTLSCGGDRVDAKLRNGKWVAPGGPENGAVDSIDVVYANVNGNKGDEAIIALECLRGVGSSDPNVLVYKLDGNGQPVQVGQTIRGRFKIANAGGLVTQDPVYGPDDPKCCPSSAVDNEWQFNGSSWEVGWSSPAAPVEEEDY